MIRHHHQTILGDIPSDWDARPLRSLLADDLSGDWGDDEGEVSLSVLRSTNFTDSGNLKLEDVATRGFTRSKAEQVQVQPYDILVERSGGGPNQPVGRVAMIREAMPNTGFANFVQTLRPDAAKISPELLLWTLHQLNRSGFVEKLQNQTTQMRNLDLRDYLKVLVPVPRNPKEQTRIAEVLKAADDHIRALEEQIRKAEGVKKALLQSLFVVGLPGNRFSSVQSSIGPIPSHWVFQRLGKTFREPPFNGVSPESRPNPPGTPILNVSCVNNGRCTVDSVTYVDVDEATIRTNSAEKGDFFVLRGNGNRNYVGTGGWLREIPPKNCIFSDKLIRLRFDTTRVAEGFYPYLWQSRAFQIRLQSKAQSSSGLWMMNKRDISREWVALPPKDEQTQMVEILDSASDNLSALQGQLLAARRVKQSLLQNLLTGKIRLKP